MESLEISNPFMLVFCGLILLVVLYFWNKQNQASSKKWKNKTFKERYQERKKEQQDKR
tara:strand:- start:22324 stop:22497 length:174 start_codon:yes stop_codon:yes gene_type:complete